MDFLIWKSRIANAQTKDKLDELQHELTLVKEMMSKHMYRVLCFFITACRQCLLEGHPE